MLGSNPSTDAGGRSLGALHVHAAWGTDLVQKSVNYHRGLFMLSAYFRKVTNYNFPKNKKFAFTIIDDTDYATIFIVKEVYDFLYSLGMLTTKTVWVYPPKDKFKGESLQNYEYLSLIKEIKDRGFEIALHGIGSGNFSREEIISGLETYKKMLGEYPKIHINHSSTCMNNIYWGHKRFCFPFNKIIHHCYPPYKKEFEGELIGSPYFWGDKHKEFIKFTRNHEVDDINTSKFDPYMPYLEKSKIAYSTYWFSSTIAPNPKVFNKIITLDSINRLANEKGIAILYCHLASFFKNGKLDKEFAAKMEYLSKKDGWFVPASTILEFLLLEKNKKLYISKKQKIRLSVMHLTTRLRYCRILKNRLRFPNI